MFGIRWSHPGKKEITFSMKGVTPALCIVVDPEVDGPALAATLTERIKECVASTICESVNELLEYEDSGLQILCSQEEILLSASAYREQRAAIMRQLHELCSISDANFYATLDNHPDNGNFGMWLISGIRHRCIVNRVSTAREAFDRAIASGKVDNWESCMVNFLDPEGPEVFPV